jgi:outer membrane protein TolC
LRKGSFLPSLAVAVDYGYQGEKYRFGADDDYWMASAVLSWNLFNGFSDRARIQSAQLEVERLRARKEEIRGKIELELRDAVQRMAVNRKALAAARKGRTSARKSFDIVKAKYEQGMAPQIEFLDARTSHTAAELELILTRYDLHISRAELERAAAQFILPDGQ